LFDGVGYEENPIWTESGLAQIRGAIMKSGVSVRTICADYFVAHRFVGVSEAERQQHTEVLNLLITRAPEVGARVIVLPLLELGEIRDAEERAVFLQCLPRPLALAEAVGVTLAVESDMPADHYLDLMGQAAHPALRICFDTGNRTAKGMDIVTDIGRLTPYVCEVHIKDRLRNGPNVPLGAGAVPFDGFFARLAIGGYLGPLILETTVGGDYEYHAKRNLEFVRSHVRCGAPGAVDANV
jgi:L-ribulose-5-phosphate 3-epimerase